MKKRIPVLILALLLALLPACGKNGAGKGGDAPDADAVAALTAEKYSEKVETMPEGYQIDAELLHGTRDNEPAFDAGVLTDAGADFTVARFAVTLRKMGEDASVFDFVLAMSVPAALTEGDPATPARLMAKYGEKYLFSFRLMPDDNEETFLYDAAANELTAFGEFCAAMFFGDRIFLQPMTFAETAPSTAYLVGWDGRIVTGYQNFRDARLVDDTLYLLRGADPATLDAVPVKNLSDPALSPLVENVCDFGEYDAAFNGEDRLVIQPLAGGYPTVCAVADAAVTLASLQAGEKVSGDPITESCGRFSLTLPASWKDKYVCEADEDGMTFYHKATHDANGEGFLFGVGLAEMPDDLRNAGVGGLYSFYMPGTLTDEAGKTWLVQVSYEEDAANFPNAWQREVFEMLPFAEQVGYRLNGVDGNEFYLRFYDDFFGAYAGTDEIGDPVKLTLDRGSFNILHGRLWRADADGSNWSSFAVTLLMFGDSGILTRDEDVYEDEIPAGYLSGIVDFTGDGAQLSVSGDGDVGFEASLERVYVPRPWERDYISGTFTAENSLFSVSMPDCWFGLVRCSVEENALRFYHLPSQELGYTGYICGLEVMPEEEADIFMNPVRRYTDNGKTLTLALSEPSDMQAPLEYVEQYVGIAAGIPALVRSAAAVKPGATIEKYDLGFTDAAYTARTDKGFCRLYLTEEYQRYASGDLTVEAPDGEDFTPYEAHFYFDQSDFLCQINRADLTVYDAYQGSTYAVSFENGSLVLRAVDDMTGSSLPAEMVFTPGQSYE